MSGEYTLELIEKGVSFSDRLAEELLENGFTSYGVSFSVEREVSGGLYFSPNDKSLSGAYSFYATPFFEEEPVLPVSIEIDGFLEKNETYYIAPNKLDTYERFKEFINDGINEAIESDILDIKMGAFEALK